MEDERAAGTEAYERLNRILHRFDRAFSQAATKMGLSDSALDVFWSIYEIGEGCLQRDICEVSCLGKQTVNSSVRKLVSTGMLRLEPAEVGRGMRVYLTPEGRQLMKERVVPICEADSAAFASLAPEDQRTALRVSQTYLDQLERRLANLPAPSPSDTSTC